MSRCVEERERAMADIGDLRRLISVCSKQCREYATTGRVGKGVLVCYDA